jgi:hypothetical protein
MPVISPWQLRCRPQSYFAIVLTSYTDQKQEQITAKEKDSASSATYIGRWEYEF